MDDDTTMTMRIREWGNSYGIMIPKSVLKDKKMSNGEEIDVVITKKKKGNTFRETFGKVKFKESTEKIMKEIDRELYNE